MFPEFLSKLIYLLNPILRCLSLSKPLVGGVNLIDSEPILI